MKWQSAIAGTLLVLGACAKLPPVNYSYFPSMGTAVVTITQSLDCSKDQKRLVVITTPPVVAVKYAADHFVGPWTVEASRLRGELANNDFALSLYEDGRLKGINAQSTGQGEAILKSVVSLVTTALPLVGGAGNSGKRDPKLPECQVIANWGGGKPVSLNYAGLYDLRGLASSNIVAIDPVPDSKQLRDELNRANRIGRLQARLQLSKNEIVPGSSLASSSGRDSYVHLKLQRIALGTMQILSSGTPIWTGTLLVPRAESYELPIPRAALFGKSTFAVEVAESGAVTKLQYGRETGAAGPVNVLTAAATAATPRSAAEQAADMKAQADLIAQSQRLARCQAKPDQCQ